MALASTAAAPGDEDAAEAHRRRRRSMEGDGGSVVRLEPMRAKRGSRRPRRRRGADVGGRSSQSVWRRRRRSTCSATHVDDAIGNTTLFLEAATADEARAGGFARPLAIQELEESRVAAADVEGVKIMAKRAAALKI